MYLTDKQILLLEQLTYFGEAVANAAGVRLGDLNQYRSVEELLAQFDEEALEKLENHGDFGFDQGNEWAAIIRAIKADKDLMSLKIDSRYTQPDINGKPMQLAIVFVDENEPDKAYVCFAGTTGGREWYDDAEGLNRSDTEVQKETIAYIDSLPYKEITVSGHSKGGNKAQYVAILSDKVTRCVSMDGQGFSREFLEKYRAEIAKNAHKIKNYALCNDYVHILLYPVPGSEQIYVEGDGMKNGAENHAASSFFHYKQDKNGHWVLETEDGTIRIYITEEAAGMQTLHKFLNYVLYVASDEDREKIVEYVGNLLKLFGGEDGTTVNGYTKDQLIEYALSDPDKLAVVLAYLLKYADVYGLTDEQVLEILDAMGLGFISEAFREYKKENGDKVALGEEFLNRILDNLRDGKLDPMILLLLAGIRNYIKEKFGIDVDLTSLWMKTEKKYHQIPKVDTGVANQNQGIRGCKTYNFSQEALDTIIHNLDQFGVQNYYDVSRWSMYSGEKWYSSLMVGTARSGVNAFIERLDGINQECRSRINCVFHQEWDIDQAAGNNLQDYIDAAGVSAMEYGMLAKSLAK